jgi:S-methylmethionine-dependent homocysteine/selenocysteine methylase
MKKSEMIKLLTEKPEIDDPAYIHFNANEAEATLKRLEDLGMLPPASSWTTELRDGTIVGVNCTWEPEDET